MTQYVNRLAVTRGVGLYSSSRFHEFIVRQTTLADSIAAERISIDGDRDAVHEFVGYLDPPPTDLIKIVTR